MVMVIDGDDETFDDLVYGRHNRGTMDRLNHYKDTRDDRRGSLIGRAREFVGRRASEIFRSFDESDEMRRIRASLRKVQSTWVDDGITELRTVGEFQHARQQMRRWVMANPNTRRRFYEQRCEGYGDRYRDLEPGAIGRNHYDYRRVTTGVFMTHPNGKFSATTWFEDLRPGDEQPIFAEQSDILDSWDTANAFFAKGKEDITSPSNAPL